jgi:DNA invertase Pin-like site-specific DNA recombinase
VLAQALADTKANDILIVVSLDRWLARSLSYPIVVIEDLEARGAFSATCDLVDPASPYDHSV